MHRIVILLSLITLLALAPAAALGDEERSDLRVLLSPEGMAAGDHDAVMRDLVGTIERRPDSPYVPIALRMMSSARTFAVDDSETTERLLAVLERGFSNGENEGAVRRWLTSRMRAKGKLELADALEADKGYVVDWAVVGPFGSAARSILDYHFAPETDLDLGKAYPTEGGDRRFLRLPVNESGAGVRPFRILVPGNGVAYALAQVRSERSGPAVLKVNIGSGKVWLNGDEVLRSDRLRDRLPRTQFVGVALREGWNRILVKVIGDATFSLKIIDESGRPFEGLTVEATLELHDVTGPAETEPGHLMPAEFVIADGDEDYAIAAEGLLKAEQGLEMAALDLAERAAANAPADPALQYRLGVALEGANELPEVWRKNRAKVAYRQALELSPGFTPAALRLVLLKHADDKTEEAVADLRALLKDLPGHLEARMTMARLCTEKGWEKEGLEAVKACLSRAPGFTPAIQYLVGYYQRYGNTAEVEALTKQLLEKDWSDYGAIRSLVTIAADAGELGKAIDLQERICRLFPDHAGSRLSLAQFLIRADRIDEARTILTALAKRYPLNPRYPREIGDLLRTEGQLAPAIGFYLKSLKLGPYQADLRRYVDRLLGVKEDFALPYETEVLDLIPDSPGREDYPKAPAIALLDQTVMRVWPDGSSTEVVHMAYKILDEKGIAAFGRVNTEGETLEIRTVNPAGEVFEPIGVSRNTYNMPALAAGSVVEYRYRVDRRRDPRSFDTGHFYFQDPDLDNVVLLSRWIVILPKGLDADLMLRNFEGKHEVTENEDTVVHVFEVENSPRVEREPFMPARDDLIPWARFLRNPPIEDVNFIHSDRLSGGLAPTSLIEREAARVADPFTDPIEKAEALYAFVNDLVTGSFSFGGPTATLIEKAGDRFDLFAALLRAEEVEFELCMAAPDRGVDIDWEVVNANVFRQRCIRIPGTDGEPVWVFMGQRFAPFGRIPDRFRDSPVLVTGPLGGRIEVLPPEPDSEHMNVTTARIRLDADPAATKVDLSFLYGSDGGYGYKEQMRNRDTDDRRQAMEGWVSSHFTGPVLESFDFPDLETLGTTARLEVAARVPNYLLPDPDGFKAGLAVSTLDLSDSYVGKPERIHPMVIRRSFSVDDRAEIDLGGEYVVKGLPKGHVTLGPLGFYSLSVVEEDGKIIVRRAARFHDTRLTQDEYKDMVRWVKAIDKAEGQKILLSRKTP